MTDAAEFAYNTMMDEKEEQEQDLEMGEAALPYERAALREYAVLVGENWKEELLHDWSRAGSRHVPHDTYSILHGIRNHLGPDWLAKFRFPEEAS
jgi:hypothetical protein